STYDLGNVSDSGSLSRYSKSTVRRHRRVSHFEVEFAVNPFDFKSKSEYEAYIRDNEFRTLNSDLVKGYQELLIANFLYENGVEYKYESPYVTKRRIDIGFDYRPDFKIIEPELYIEHFGVDRNGRTRPDTCTGSLAPTN
ncbi:hypothetical protein, partial [Aeromonas caviae]